MGRWEGKREGREKREMEGTPRVGSHPHVWNPEKYPDNTMTTKISKYKIQNYKISLYQ